MKDKDYTVIIENLVKLLSYSSLAIDQVDNNILLSFNSIIANNWRRQQSDVYFEVLDSLKEDSQNQENEVIIKIYENAIRAMINVSLISYLCVTALL